MAGKQRFTVAQVVGAVTEAKGMVSYAARELNCALQIVRNYARRYPAVREAMDESRKRMKDAAERSLFRAVERGQAWAVIWFLKTQSADRGYVERHKLDLLVEREIERMLGILEAGLDPVAFRQAAALLAEQGQGGRG